jgi:CBS domain-containing membrane protein
MTRRIAFVPILAGARFADRLSACFGALLGIALTSLICACLPLEAHHLPLLVGPLGASAVLLFAVPASPLAQPWPIVGGNTISALVGVAIAYVVPNTTIAAGLAVAVAILFMSLLRCLHPPGGAAALTGVIGGPSVLGAGFLFPFVPVALNSLILVGLGWVFHRFSRHSYPHNASDAHTANPAPSTELELRDIDKALDELGEAFDVSREDLEILFQRAEVHAGERRAAQPSKAARTLAH